MLQLTRFLVRIVLPLILFSAPLSAQDTTDVFAAFLEAHYDGGERAFLEDVYQTIRYPQAARANCGIGHLRVRVIVKADGGLQRITFLTPFGYGVPEEVTRVLSAHQRKWIGTGHAEQLDFSIGYQLGGSPEVKGDVTVVAYTVGNPHAPSGCPANEDLEKRLRRAAEKGREHRVKELTEELLRRGYDDPAFLEMLAVAGR